MKYSLRALVLLGLFVGVTEARIFRKRCARPRRSRAVAPGQGFFYANMITINKVIFTDANGVLQTKTYDSTVTYEVDRRQDVIVEATLNYDPGDPVTSFLAVYEVTPEYAAGARKGHKL